MFTVFDLQSPSLLAEPKKLAADLGGSIVILNPPKPTAQKWWVVDELYVYAAGETFDFSGIKALGWPKCQWPIWKRQPRPARALTNP